MANAEVETWISGSAFLHSPFDCSAFAGSLFLRRYALLPTPYAPRFLPAAFGDSVCKPQTACTPYLDDRRRRIVNPPSASSESVAGSGVGVSRKASCCPAKA
jgi:hypothetical protein